MQTIKPLTDLLATLQLLPSTARIGFLSVNGRSKTISPPQSDEEAEKLRKWIKRHDSAVMTLVREKDGIPGAASVSFAFVTADTWSGITPEEATAFVPELAQVFAELSPEMRAVRRLPAPVPFAQAAIK